MNRELARLIFSVESADIRPAEAVRAAVQQNCDALDKDLASWRQLNEQVEMAFMSICYRELFSCLNKVSGGSIVRVPITVSS